MKRFVLVAVIFILAGCRHMPYHETLRPNADISNDPGWVYYAGGTDFFSSINQEVGVVGNITGIDTNRIASWNGHVESQINLAEFRVGWSNWAGPSSMTIGKLEFTYAIFAWDIGAGGPFTIECEVYINGSLAGSFDMEGAASLAASPPGDHTYTVQMAEIVTEDFPGETDINTLETVFRSIGSGHQKLLYAIECEAYESEKIIDPSTPTACKTIPVVDAITEPMEKKI